MIEVLFMKKTEYLTPSIELLDIAGECPLCQSSESIGGGTSDYDSDDELIF